LKVVADVLAKIGKKSFPNAPKITSRPSASQPDQTESNEEKQQQQQQQQEKDLFIS